MSGRAARDWPFDRRVRGARVAFGVGAVAQLAEVVEGAGVERALTVGTPGRRHDLEALSERLGSRCVGVFSGARQHVPAGAVDEAVARVDEATADALVTYGGGSAIGLAKAVALRRDVSIVAVPTTYSGSEMTPIWGLTQGGDKVTGRDERVRPRAVIYDPEHTVDLPMSVSVPSLFNAMAHAAEALYAEGAGADVIEQAERSIAAIGAGLEALARDAADLEARSEALYGAHLAGMCLDGAAMGLHHKLAHVLGGRFDLPHAETHTVLLPHVMAYNRSAAPGAMERLGRALGGSDGPRAVWELQGRVGAPRRLADLGFKADDVPGAVAAALERSYPNPRPLERAGLTRLLEDALAGRAPRSEAARVPER